MRKVSHYHSHSAALLSIFTALSLSLSKASATQAATADSALEPVAGALADQAVPLPAAAAAAAPTAGSVRTPGAQSEQNLSLIGTLEAAGSEPISALGIVVALTEADLLVNSPSARVLTVSQTSLPRSNQLYPYAFTLTGQTPAGTQADSALVARVYITAGNQTTYGPTAQIPMLHETPEGASKLQTLNSSSRVTFDSYTALSMNADGTRILALRAKVTALTGDCYLERSTDSGATWTQLSTFAGVVGYDGLSPNSQIVASADQRVIGIIISSNALNYASLGRAYLSRDSGSTWEELKLPDPGVNEPWAYDAIALSADGGTIALSHFTKPNSGQDSRAGYRPGIAISTVPLSGALTWASFPISNQGTTSSKLNSMHMSADGNRVVYSMAPTSPDTTTKVGQIVHYYGTWIQGDITQLGEANWKCSFISPDGNTLFASNGQTTYRSRDGGTTWTAVQEAFTWANGMASSHEANKLLWISTSATSLNHIQRSIDAGTTVQDFSNNSITFNWTSVACSTDGLKQIASAYGGEGASASAQRGVYRLSNPNPTLQAFDGGPNPLSSGATLRLGTIRGSRPNDSNRLNLVLSNPGAINVNGLGISIRGGSPGQFAFALPEQAAALQAHHAIEIPILFNANQSAQGTKSATLEITSQDLASPLIYNLSASIELGPIIELALGEDIASPKLDLNLRHDLEYGSHTLRLYNQGTSPLVIEGFEFTNNRLSRTDSLILPQTIPPQQTLHFRISCAGNPNSSAAQDSVLTVHTNCDDPNTNVMLRLTQSELEVSVDEVPIDSDSSPLTLPQWAPGTEIQSRAFTVRNVGSAPLRNLVFRPIPEPGFQRGSIQWPLVAGATLAPGESSVQRVLFGQENPVDRSEGLKSEGLSIQSNDPNQPDFTLHAIGTQLSENRELHLTKGDGEALIGGSVLNFGPVINAHPSGVNRVLTIQNLGNTVLGNLRLTVGGRNSADFSVMQGIPTANARAGLDSASKLPIILRFKPTGSATGNRSATLTVASNDSDEASTVITLSGTAVNPSAASDLYILGDGQSDVGKGAEILGGANVLPSWSSPPAASGRATHGALWADFLNAASQPFTNAAASGRNLAVNLSRLDDHPQGLGSLASSALSVAAQADLLLAAVAGLDGAGRFRSQEHLLIWAGQADLLRILHTSGPDRYQTLIGGMKVRLGQKITSLAGLEATRIMLVTLPDTSPHQQGSYSQKRNMRSLIGLWNAALADLAAEHPTSTLLIDLNAAHDAILSQAQALGFTEAEQLGVESPLRSDARLYWSRAFWSSPTNYATPVASRRLHALWASQMGVFGAASPEISVKQSATSFTNGVTVLSVSSPTQVQVVNTGTSSLNALGWCLLGPDATHFSAEEHDGTAAARWTTGYLPPPSGKARESAPAHLKLDYNNASVGAGEAGLHQAVLRITSSDRDEGYFDIALRRSIAPAGQTLAMGAALNLQIRNQAGQRYQWKKNGVNLNGELSAGLYIPQVQLSDAGTYSIEITLPNAQKVLIGGIEVVVVNQNQANPIPLTAQNGRSLSLATQFGASSITRSQLRFQWYQGQTLLAGQTLSTLRIASLTETATGLYSCLVTSPASAGSASLNGGYHLISLVNSSPTLAAQEMLSAPVPAKVEPRVEFQASAQAALPILFAGVVGKWVEQRTAHLALGTISNFSASGLPPGLQIHPTLGLITGHPSKAGDYSMKLTLANAAGRIIVNQLARIESLPKSDGGIALSGASYGGVIQRHELNRQAGGRIELTLTGGGMISGSVIFGAQPARRFVGGLDSGATWRSRSLILPPTPSDPQLQMDLEWKAEGCLCTLTRLQAANSPSLATLLWPQASPTEVANSALSGSYTLALQPSETDPSRSPSGTGWLRMSIAPTGLCTMAGRTAEGMTVTLSSSLSADGKFGVYLGDSTGRSLVSDKNLRLAQPDAGVSSSIQTKVAGTGSYTRAANPKAANYTTGFSQQALKIFGGREPRATTGAPPLNYTSRLEYKHPEPLPLPAVATQPNFWRHLESTVAQPTLRFWWDAKGLSTLLESPNETNGNPVFSINPLGGEVAGRLTLTNRGVIGANPKTGLQRLVSFSGVLVRVASPDPSSADQFVALGHCLVRQRPSSILQTPSQMPQISLPWSLSRD